MKRWLGIVVLLFFTLPAVAQAVGSFVPCPQGFAWGNQWSASTAYAKCVVVQYYGASWIAIAANYNSPPALGSVQWNLFAAAGAKGDQGDAATITVGKVAALPPGSAPTVKNTGTQQNAVLNFGLTTGNTGNQGLPGPPIAGLSGDGQGNIAVAGRLTAASVATNSPGPTALTLNQACPAASSIPAGSFALCINTAGELACLTSAGKSCMGAAGVIAAIAEDPPLPVAGAWDEWNVSGTGATE